MAKFSTLCLILSLFVTPAFAGSTGKPSAPITLTISPNKPEIISKPGDLIELKASALSNSDLPQVSISLDVPGNVQLISGDLSWKGPLQKSQERALIFMVRSPMNGGGTIKAKAEIPGAQGPAFSANATYNLDRTSLPKQNSVSERRTVKDRNGDRVIEHPAK